MSAVIYAKDPDATLDFTVDWSAWLVDDTISAVNWIVPTGLTKTQQSNTATAATVWLSGGADGFSYAVTCRITTGAGRIDDRSFTVAVSEQ